MNVRQVLPRDAIPSVDDPTFGDRYPGEPDDQVLVESADRPRAYPVRYLHYHEIVNDVVAGDPIAVTWCPLCGSAVVYSRRHGGRTLEFGVSGKLADDDLVMYDRETGSEWKQSTGECIAGPLEGASLTVRPASMMTWGQFRESYPEGVVLQKPGVESEGEALGFPLPRVQAAGGVGRATVGDRDVVVFAGADSGIHGFVDPGHAFEWSGGEVVGDGTTWDLATGRAADGRRLERLPARRLFAFAWQDDHGPDSFAAV